MPKELRIPLSLDGGGNAKAVLSIYAAIDLKFYFY